MGGWVDVLSEVCIVLISSGHQEESRRDVLVLVLVTDL